MPHEGDGTHDNRNLPYTPAAMGAALRAGIGSRGAPQQGGSLDLDLIRALLGQSGEMTAYERAKIAAENRALDLRAGEAGQRASSDAASNSIAAASQAATQAWYEAQAANQRGDLELARRKQDESNYWNRVSQEFSAQSAAREETGLATDAFRAQETSRGARAGEQLDAGTLYGNLAQTMGNLAVEQQKLGLDILTRPRNAVAGFLMGLGENEAAKSFGNFDIKSILGIDPSSIQGFIQQAVGAAQAAQAQARSPQQIDLPTFLAGIDAAAKRISAGAGGGAQVPQMPGAPAAAAPATPGAGSTAPDFQRQPPGVMTIPGDTLSAFAPELMPAATPAPFFPFDAAAGYSDTTGMAGGTPSPYTGPMGAPPPAVPSMTVPGMYPGAAGPQTSTPAGTGNPFLDQLDALLFGGGGLGYDQPPTFTPYTGQPPGAQTQQRPGVNMGSPDSQEVWGRAMAEALMRQFQGGQ